MKPAVWESGEVVYMLQSCTKRYADKSDEQVFRFVFFCDDCGRAFHSAPIPFTGGGVPPGPPVETELWKLRWQEEHTKAFARANREAMLRYFCCPGCGKYICPGCVVSQKTASGDIRDLCRECSARSCRLEPFKMIEPPAGGKGEFDDREKPFARVNETVL